MIEKGYREDFMQKTFEKKLMIQDRVTNLRRYSANINDFSNFKRMSKKFQIPDFKTATIEKKIDMGLLDRKQDVSRDKSPNDRNLKQFYLSHHSELMATKSVSKVHRR